MTERDFNTTTKNEPFNAAIVKLLWEKAGIAMGYDPELIRKDCLGSIIKKHAYGDTSTPFGWEIDHIVPVSKGGADFIGNLQPLQWKNNRKKSDTHPEWASAV